MPAPRNPKEVKQFLGLVGYYRKFVPRFADISRVLTHLTKKDVEFKWTPECKNCFQILKEFLQQAPILGYPDPRPVTHSTQMHQNMLMQAYWTTQQQHGSPHHLHKRTIPWITVKLDNTHKRSLCNLHVSKETQFLHRHSQNNSQKRSPPTKEILGKEHLKLQSEQLGSWIRITKHNIWVHPQNPEHFGWYLI